MTSACSLVAPGGMLAVTSKVADAVQPGASIRSEDLTLYATSMSLFNEACVNVIRSGELVPGPPHPVTGQTSRDLGRKGPTGGDAGLMDATSNDSRRS